MANRKNPSKKSQRNSSGGNCGTKQPQGVHAVAEELKKTNKISAANAYKKALKMCKETPLSEVEKIAARFEINLKDLLPA